MSLIKAAGAGDQSTGFYKHLLDQSLKFNDGDSQYLTRTPASAGNRKTWTWSAWVKLGHIPADGDVLFAGEVTGSGNEGSKIRFYDKQIAFLNWESSGGARYFQVRTNRLFRDTSAWYHIVVALDTTQSTAANRVKIYVNGTQETSLSATQYGSQNDDLAINNTVKHYLGAGSSAGTVGSYFDGYIAEVNLIDGQALTPASFGETIEGIWTPKDTSGLTFGTNGFHLTFKDDVVSEGFNAVTYTGTGANNSISGIGFDPALVWIKSRSNTYDNQFYDTVRGPTKRIFSNKTDAELTGSDLVQSFDADGFTIGTNVGLNNSGSTYVGWCWEADTAFSNDASATGVGNIDSSGKTNTAKGFSIIKWTYSTSADNLIAHGLGAVPTWILIKSRTTAYNWDVYHSGLSAASKRLKLNSSDAEVAGFFDTTPTSTVFEYNTSASVNNDEMIAYCWTDISGYSKFGTYTGNGSATGPSVTLGFTPAYILLKRTDGGSEDWNIHDNTRSPANPITDRLFADLNTAETTSSGYAIDFNSNGFQLKGTDGGSNASGATYIYAAFADTREAAFFKDVSTNGNHFTPVNLDYRDSVPDVPTNNFNVLNPLHSRLDGGANVTISEGNLQIFGGSNYGGDNRYAGTTGVSSGKWYFEMLRTDATGIGNQTATGVFDASTPLSSGAYSGNGTNSGAAANEWALTDRGYACNTSTYTNLSGTIGTVTQNKVVQVAVDMDNKKIWFGIDNTFAGDPAAGSGQAFANLPTTILPLAYHAQSTQVFNFGQDSSFAGNKSTANSNADGNGIGSFAYAPPSGFLALCSQNLPDVEIIDGTEHFNTVLYTGNATNPRNVTGVGFSPDFIWAKVRSNSYPHFLVNSVIGANKYLNTNSTDAETTTTGYYQSFDSDGFTVDNSGGINGNGETFVAWNWLAGTAFSNDASATGVGTIDSTGQVNTKAGFSIVSYTGNNGSSGSFAHGLGVAPNAVIIKSRTDAANWAVGHDGLTSWSYYIALNNTAAQVNDSANFNGTAPTSTVVNIGGSGNTNDAEDYIAYCFHSVEGYSKVGSYIGNGSADGVFVQTNFRVSWVLIKWSNGSQDWTLFDNKRPGFNETDKYLHPSASAAEGDYDTLEVDLLSNGFKCRGPYNHINTSGGNYIYLAFADQPFKFSNAF